MVGQASLLFSVSGPGDGTNVDDYYSPEINSIPVNLPQVTNINCNPLPDQTAVSSSNAWTDSFANIQCYDSLKVQAILNEIDGKDHSGTVKRPVPIIFGMNFQVVSVGQKLIEKSTSMTGGYLDNVGTPTPALLGEIEFADTSIGKYGRRTQGSGFVQFDPDHHFRQAWPEPDRLRPLPGHRGSVEWPDNDIAGDDSGEPASVLRITGNP